MMELVGWDYIYVGMISCILFGVERKGIKEKIKMDIKYNCLYGFISEKKNYCL